SRRRPSTRPPSTPTPRSTLPSAEREAPSGAAAAGRTPIRSILSASAGHLVEWFDFYVYAFTALYFSSAFFPGGSPTAQLMKTSGVYALGFFARPLGSWIFGRLADRTGRRRSMVISMLMMSFGSLMIAALPTYATVGAMAPVLLTLARVIQGISV